MHRYVLEAVILWHVMRRRWNRKGGNDRGKSRIGQPRVRWMDNINKSHSWGWQKDVRQCLMGGMEKDDHKGCKGHNSYI